MPESPFRRVLVKLSGEALAAPDGYWLHPPTLAGLAEDIARTIAEGIEVALVVGGGNMIRGARISQAGFIDRATGDSLGMMATVMNSLALETALNAAGVQARTMSAVKPCSRALPMRESLTLNIKATASGTVSVTPVMASKISAVRE